MLETRRYQLRWGLNQTNRGSFALTLHFDRLRGKSLFLVLRNALRREAHFRAYPVTAIALYSQDGKLLVPRQPQPPPEESFIQKSLFLYPDYMPKRRR
jgi:hypothetical protein